MRYPGVHSHGMEKSRAEQHIGKAKPHWRLAQRNLVVLRYYIAYYFWINKSDIIDKFWNYIRSLSEKLSSYPDAINYSDHNRTPRQPSNKLTGAERRQHQVSGGSCLPSFGTDKTFVCSDDNLGHEFARNGFSRNAPASSIRGAITSTQSNVISKPYRQIVLLATAIICLQDATYCFGADSSQYRDHRDHIDLHYPTNQSPMAPQPNINALAVVGRRSRRFYLENPAQMSSIKPSSFSSDKPMSWPSFFGTTNKPSQDSLDTHLAKILVPRVSGTKGNAKVREYIVESLKSNGYHVELDQFTSSTPVGNVNFANIIASSNPKACKQLVLACHYDSKMMEGFLGATDSAVPCAMLLKMSETFKTSFRANEQISEGSSKGPSKQSDIGLRFIFFDGEEAYVQWTSSDSLYGSRHLAEKWEKQPAPSQCANLNLKNELGRIELFVLLDLIGTADTSFVMYNRQLKHHYEAMQRYEKMYLSARGLSGLQARRDAAFKNRHVPLEFVEDDHVPFMRRGVPILSLLASPFPKVWHTIDDNYEAIDFAKTRRILHVLEEFVSNYSTTENTGTDTN